ncbi:MAG: signal peptide peptidase SppA, partial [Gemmatimonadota bacterium]
MTLAGIVLALMSAGRGSAGFGIGGRIAVLSIDGVIHDDRDLLDQLREFRDDASVRGYLVEINSPGGVVAPSQSIYRELRRVRDEDEVPVVAAISGVGASGGYYIALAADSIFALPGSITGSIGVIMEVPDASELMAKVGVRMQTVMSSEHKDVGSPFRPLGAGDRAILDSLVLDVFTQFVGVVALERNLPEGTVLEIADGRILSGRQALDRRLIDRLGNRVDALATAGRMAGLGETPRTVRPPEPRATI